MLIREPLCGTTEPGAAWTGTPRTSSLRISRVPPGDPRRLAAVPPGGHSRQAESRGRRMTKTARLLQTATSTCARTADMHCMSSSGQVSVGHTEVAAMDMLEDGHIDFAPSIMPDTCPDWRSGWSSRRPRCCGGWGARPSVRHQPVRGEVGAGQARPVGWRRPEMVTRTRTPRCRPSCGRKGRAGQGVRRGANGLLLRADRLPVARHQGGRILYETGTDELRNK